MRLRIDETVAYGVKLKGFVEIEHVDAEPAVGISAGEQVTDCYIPIQLPPPDGAGPITKEDIMGLRFWNGRLRTTEIFCLHSGKPWTVTDVEWT